MFLFNRGLRALFVSFFLVLALASIGCSHDGGEEAKEEAKEDPAKEGEINSLSGMTDAFSGTVDSRSNGNENRIGYGDDVIQNPQGDAGPAGGDVSSGEVDGSSNEVSGSFGSLDVNDNGISYGNDVVQHEVDTSGGEVPPDEGDSSGAVVDGSSDVFAISGAGVHLDNDVIQHGIIAAQNGMKDSDSEEVQEEEINDLKGKFSRKSTRKISDKSSLSADEKTLLKILKEGLSRKKETKVSLPPEVAKTSPLSSKPPKPPIKGALYGSPLGWSEEQLNEVLEKDDYEYILFQVIRSDKVGAALEGELAPLRRRLEKLVQAGKKPILEIWWGGGDRWSWEKWSLANIAMNESIRAEFFNQITDPIIDALGPQNLYGAHLLEELGLQFGTDAEVQNDCDNLADGEYLDGDAYTAPTWIAKGVGRYWTMVAAFACAM